MGTIQEYKAKNSRSNLKDWKSKNKDWSFDFQGSIIGYRYDKIFKPEPQGSILRSTRIDPYQKKNLRENIPLRIDHSKTKIDLFLSLMVFFFRDSRDLGISISMPKINPWLTRINPLATDCTSSHKSAIFSDFKEAKTHFWV